jgi:hypothetical protein
MDDNSQKCFGLVGPTLASRQSVRMIRPPTWCSTSPRRWSGWRGRTRVRPLILDRVGLGIANGELAELVIVEVRQRKLTDLHGVLTQVAKGSLGKSGSQRTTASASARSKRISSPSQNADGSRLGRGSRNRSSQRRASSW